MPTFILDFIATFKEYNAKQVFQLVVTDSLIENSWCLKHLPYIFSIQCILLIYYYCVCACVVGICLPTQTHLIAYTLAFKLLSIHMFHMKSKSNVTCLRKFHKEEGFDLRLL